MKFIGKHWKLIIFFILLLISVSAIGYKTLSATTVDLTEVGGGIGKTIVLAYKFDAPEPRVIKWFPIDEDVLFVDSDFFPGSAGWVNSDYGRHASRTPETEYDTYEGYTTCKVEDKWHPSKKILATFHDVWGRKGTNLPVLTVQRHEKGYYSSKATDDGYISNDNKKIMYTDITSKTLVYDKFMEAYANALLCYKDMKLEEGTPEEPKQTVYTNWVYNGATRTQLDCEGKGGKGSGNITTGGLCFIIACFKMPDETRNAWGNKNAGLRSNFITDGVYLSLGNWLGYLNAGGWSEFYDLAVSYESYHAASKNPNVDVYPDDDVGSRYTSTSESAIQVGPFTMSDYVTASDYSVYNKDYIAGTWEREEVGDLVYETFTGERGENLQPIFGNDHLGSLLSMTAVLKNEAGATKKVLVFDRSSSTSAPMVPGPGDDFNITLSSSAASGYDELYEIECLYQRVHACANLDTYSGVQHYATLKESDTVKSKLTDEKYSCTTCVHNEIEEKDRSDNADAGFPKHEYWCGGSNWCEHGYANGQHPSENVKEHTFCEHAQAGHPEGHPHVESCYELNCGKYEHEHSDIPGSCYYKSCGKDEHEHSDDCYWVGPYTGTKYLTCSKSEHEHSDSCYTRNCGKYEHEHDSWNSNTDNGCYGKLDCQYGGAKTDYTHPHLDACHNCGGSGYCKHGHKEGKHGSTHLTVGDFSCTDLPPKASDGEKGCDGDTLCDGHNHLTCHKFAWDDELSSYGNIVDDVISTKGKLVNEQIRYTINVQVPLKTETGIYKYINKVTHSPTNKVVYDSTARRDMTAAEKEANPLKVEVGDIVEYTIEVYNDGRFPVESLIQDTLPDYCEYIECTGKTVSLTDGTTINSGSTIKIISPTGEPQQTALYWISHPAYSSTIITLKVRPLNETALETLYTNNVKFVSRNHIDTANGIPDHMQSGGWGDGNTTHGPNPGGDIINIQTRQDDADSYLVKGYKVELNKYIYNVDHNRDPKVQSTTLDTSYVASTERATWTNAQKQASPVYVEYGDIVTYKIRVNNTIEGRTEKPYYEPEKIYVDFEDTLPEKFSNLSVTCDGATVPHALNGNILTITDFEVPAGGFKEVTITLIVEEHEKGTINGDPAQVVKFHENRIRVTEIRNINNGSPDRFCVVFTEPNKGDEDPLDFNFPENTITDTSDYYVLNDYNVTVDKYLYGYDELIQEQNNGNSFSSEASISANDVLNVSREGKTEESKRAHPLSVEKNETLVYSIKIHNHAQTIGDKPGTQVRPRVYEKLEKGLTIVTAEAQLYNQAGVEVYDSSVNIVNTGTTTERDDVAGRDRIYQNYRLDIGRETIMDPGQYILIKVTVQVTESNMFLLDLRNSATLGILENINVIGTTVPEPQDGSGDGEPRQVRNDTYDENIAPDADKESSDYVRMKDLVISGKVWLDINRDGLMNAENPTTDEQTYYSVSGGNAYKSGMTVNLYLHGADGTDTLIRETKTDANGLYTFGRDIGLEWYKKHYTYGESGTTLTGDYSADTLYQRIDKASGKDANGNYTVASTYNQYYIEYEYDGVVYKSTVYAGMKNLTTNDGRYEDAYKIDSNATEFTKTREQFNSKYEYISYNVGYDMNLARTNNTETGNNGTLEFDKTGHTSQLIEDETREMTARSFIVTQDAAEILNACNIARNNCGAAQWKSCSNHWSHWQSVIAMGIIDESKYPNTTAGRLAAQDYLDSVITEVTNNLNASGDTEVTKYLWLYGFNGGIDNTIPETDYLKYINFGLMLREDVDITLSKDVYKIKTTVNGEEMEYEFNQLDASTQENVPAGMNGQGGLGEAGKNEYMSALGYNFELYESDYKYRVDQYIAEAVKAYKGQESELNVEVTYKIRVYNREVKDDERLASSTDTKLKVKIHEIMDLYDQNFIEYKNNPNESITAKVKTQDGYLVDEEIKILEMWGEKSDGTEITLEYSNESSKGNGVYSPRGTEVTNQAKQDGYKVLYIRGTETDTPKYISPETGAETTGATVSHIAELAEGEYVDIYVKYVLDKEKLKIHDPNTGSDPDVERSLKIAEKAAGKQNGMGTENVAQVNAYSVWYEDDKPASIVDMDSNAGNIGIKDDNTLGSVDDKQYYEDTTYKTGVDITAENTENPPVDDPDDPDDPDNPNESVMREFKGMIWDDARSETTGTGGETQYVGDGLYDTTKGKNTEAKSNEAVEEIYGQTEDTDIKVRNVKAEYIEIVEIPQVTLENYTKEDIIGADSEKRYYEEIMQDITWEYTQNTRTDANGAYKLNGYIPGTYVIRYTYGDSVENPYNETSQAQKDMLVFNGQDYKSTQYSEKMETASAEEETYGEKDDRMDAIIGALEAESESDARDDEIRRLRVNAYSEVMTSETAEILKGLANGQAGIEVAENMDANSKEQLQALTDNTAMNAETIEFLVRPEKMEIEGKTYTSLEEITLDDIRNISGDLDTTSYSSRTFAIENVDFGIEYRPETAISLGKEIDEIKITTEDGNVLIDLFFYTEPFVNADGENVVKHYIDEAKSTGDELTQFISNDYMNFLRSGITTEELQGFAYIQVDDDILQGATIEVVYKFTATNESEVDRISPALDAIRYKENTITVQEITNYVRKGKIDIQEEHADNVIIEDDGTILAETDIRGILDKDYTASGTASNILIADFYRRDAGGDIYRIIEKEIDTYTGRFLGETYHRHEVGNDVVSELKFDKILDYVDTDLVYIENANAQESKDREWDIANSSDLTKHVLKLRKKNAAGNPLYDKLTNIDGIEYKTLAVSVDDRRADQTPDEQIMNSSLSRFMLPKVVNEEDSKGYIYLPVSKVIASETDTKDMVYENIAEVIQFTSLTGRRTNFDTTIGNADIHEANPNATNGSEEFVTASLESDSSATETITLTPPTGLMRNRRVIVDVVETAQKTVSVTAIIAIVVTVVIILTKVIHHMYKKRRIK